MSRVKGIIILKGNTKFQETSVPYNYLMKMLLFDLWILQKTKNISKTIITLICPIMEVIFLMSFAIALIYLCGYMNLNILDASDYGNTLQKYSKLGSDSLANDPLMIEDDSSKDTKNLQKELSILKNKATNLEMTLYKMNIDLKKLFVYKNVPYEKPDFAAESVGGAIIATPNTESYYKSNQWQFSLFGIPIYKPIYFTPRKVIQPWTQAGECWSFHGSYGKIEIDLSHIIQVTHVTLEHIPISASPTGILDSAPKFFITYIHFRNKYLPIGTFKYNINGSPSQTFAIQNKTILKVPTKQVMLEILSNWGNPKYTCIYRFKVHGKLFPLPNRPLPNSDEM